MLGLKWGVPVWMRGCFSRCWTCHRSEALGSLSVWGAPMEIAARSGVPGGRVRVGLGDNRYRSRGVLAQCGLALDAAALVALLAIVRPRPNRRARSKA
ncbi:3-keto-5-aminohexanoate cleavage protein [Paracoccus aminophilus]|uniref:3-keto-5-aminohexanoate cleavage protein n=1 Tax=Paracoccus aminophilus TaxID=34003 RepID=UPI0011DD2FF5